jgi:hypothetical protein
VQRGEIQRLLAQHPVADMQRLPHAACPVQPNCISQHQTKLRRFLHAQSQALTVKGYRFSTLCRMPQYLKTLP